MKKIGIGLLAILGVFLLAACGKKEKVMYEVVFNNNGGITVVEIEENAKVTKPDTPVKDGYTFVGWFLNLNDTQSYDFNKKVTSNFTLYAKWLKKSVCNLTCGDGYVLENPETEDCSCKKVESDKEDEKENNNEIKPIVTNKYTIKFETDGGSRVANKTVTSGSKVSKPIDPTKDGYKFIGWYLNDKVYDFNSKITKNITLTAKWEKIEESKPDIPVTPEEEPKVELSYKVVEEEGSSARQVRIYLTKNDEITSGTADIVYITGKTVTVNIPKERIQETDGIFKNVINIKVD